MKLKFLTKENIHSIDDIPNLGAFIIFDRFQDKEKMKILYKKLNTSSYFEEKLWPKKDLFFDKKLTIDFDPDEPSNVKWENMDVSGIEASLRNKVVSLFLCVLLGITISILVFNR